MLALLLSLSALLWQGEASAQPYLYRADDVRGAQLFSDLSFLLGMEVKDDNSGVTRRRIVGEFRGDNRTTFLNALAAVGRFAWATRKNTLTLSSRTSLQTRTYRFVSDEERDAFWARLRRDRITAGPLIVTPLRSAQIRSAQVRSAQSQQTQDKADDKVVPRSEKAYDIQAIAAFHESAGAIYAELSGLDQNRVLSSSNSAIYPIQGERFALMIFRLQYAWADDTPVGSDGKLLPGVAGFMEKIVAARYGISAPRRVASAPVQQGGLEHIVAGGLKKIQELGILPPASSRTPVPGSKSSTGAPAPSASAAASGQTLATGGKSSPVIFADPRQNAIIIYDDRSRYNDYRKLVAELDSRTRLVKIEAAIIDISKSRVSDLGIQWGGSYGGNQASFGDLAQGAASGALAVATQGWSLSNNAIISDVNGLIARINILESQGKGRIVSRPSILTLDNIEASLTASQKFFVKVEAFQDSSLYPVEVGTTLRVTPHIIRDGQKTRIKLLVVIEDGSIDQSSASAVGGLPRISTNNLTTQAEILETQALVIGGHIRSEVEVRRQRVPFLGHIPILGLPFRSKTKQRREFVRLYIIRPRLTLPADDMEEAEGLIEDEKLFAYPKLLKEEREKADRIARKRQRKDARRAEKARAKAERQRQRTFKKQQRQRKKSSEQTTKEPTTAEPTTAEPTTDEQATGGEEER